MTECLHCEINALVDRHEAAGETDVLTLAAKIVESLADMVLSVPPEEQGMMIAEIIAQFGHMIVEKSEMGADGSSTATH
jgi:hypothetical protein